MFQDSPVVDTYTFPQPQLLLGMFNKSGKQNADGTFSSKALSHLVSPVNSLITNKYLPKCVSCRPQNALNA